MAKKAEPRGHQSKQEPKLMDMMRMKDIFMPHLEQIRDNVYFSNEIGILQGSTQMVHRRNRPLSSMTTASASLYEVRDASTSTSSTAISVPERSSISPRAPSSTPFPSLMTWNCSASHSFPTFPCPFHRDRCLQLSTDRCATSNCPFPRMTSKRQTASSMQFGSWSINQTITGPLYPLSWLP